MKTVHRAIVDEHQQQSDTRVTAAGAAAVSKDERTVFVYNFRKTMQRPDLQKVFAQFGEIEALKLPIDQNAKHRSKLRGLAYVTYKRKADADTCIAELNGKSIQGKVLNVQHYRSKSDASKTVHIRGLSGFDQSAAEQCVRQIFKECGEIKEIRLTKDQKSDGSRLKGFGYVEFMENASVVKALKCDKAMYGDKIIEVLPYKADDKRDKKIGHYGHTRRKHDRDEKTTTTTSSSSAAKIAQQEMKSEAMETMDVDDGGDGSQHRHSKELNAISSEFGTKLGLGFVPRSMRRKSALKQTNDHHEHEPEVQQATYDAQILNKSNKTQNDFRKLFNL